MKNRRLLTILIIFVIVGSFAVLGSALFSVRTVEIQFTNAFDFFKGEEQRQDLESRLMASVLPVTKGRSILFGINRNEIINRLEAAETRIRWTNTEAFFPNKLVIKVRERYPVFKFKSGDLTAVLDGGLRILDKLNLQNFDILEEKMNWPLIELPEEIGNSLVFSELNIGDFLTKLKPDSAEIKVLEQLTPFFARIKTNEDAICNIFESISINNDVGEMRLVMKSRTEMTEGNSCQSDFEFIVWNPADGLDEKPESLLNRKLLKGWILLEENHTEPGIYQVYANREGELQTPDGLTVTYKGWEP